MENVLVINPGSTSTKLAVYSGERQVYETTIRHDVSELEEYASIIDQFAFRKQAILNGFHQQTEVRMQDLNAVIGRGGLMKPIKGGVYLVNDHMLEDLRAAARGQHASNLGGVLTREIADQLGIPALTADPVITDELDDIARVSGVPQYQRASLYHALNQKAVARRAAADLGKTYQTCNFVVAHLGGGISVGAHRKGRVVDTNSALLGDGPFSPERAGRLALSSMIDLCFSGLSKDEVRRALTVNAGMSAYLGTNSGIEVGQRIDAGDRQAAFIYEAMAYNIAKEIGQMATVLKGEIDQILLTGGLACDDRMVGMIKERVGFLAEIRVFPGELEMTALAERALAVLRGEIQLQVY